jgi:hypothetical protein
MDDAIRRQPLEEVADDAGKLVAFEDAHLTPMIHLFQRRVLDDI